MSFLVRFPDRNIVQTFGLIKKIYGRILEMFQEKFKKKLIETITMKLRFA